MRFPRLARAALAATALMAAGCDTSSSLAVSPNPAAGSGAASYALATVNGAPLPFDTRSDASGRVSITQGLLTVTGDGAFQQNLTLSETPSGGTASLRQSASQGTYTVSGDRIRFRATDGGEWEGTVGNNRIDYSVPGNNGSFTFSFRRS